MQVAYFFCFIDPQLPLWFCQFHSAHYGKILSYSANRDNMLFLHPIFITIKICPPSFHPPSIYKLSPAYTRLLHTLLRLLSFLCESAISSWKIFQYFPHFHKYYLWSFHHGTWIALISMIAAISVVDGPVCKNSADNSCLFWAFRPGPGPET